MISVPHNISSKATVDHQQANPTASGFPSSTASGMARSNLHIDAIKAILILHSNLP